MRRYVPGAIALVYGVCMYTIWLLMPVSTVDFYREMAGDILCYPLSATCILGFGAFVGYSAGKLRNRLREVIGDYEDDGGN